MSSRTKSKRAFDGRCHGQPERRKEPEVANFVITGKAEQTDESSYTVQSTGEVVTKIQLSLNVPGMTDWMLCEMPLDVSPKPTPVFARPSDETSAPCERYACYAGCGSGGPDGTYPMCKRAE
jgi:hypothetical protein